MEAISNDGNSFNKPRRSKGSATVKKTRHEKTMVIVLTTVIILLVLALGYNVYTFFKTKAEARTEISSLNGSINTLSAEKAQLIKERDNLIVEKNVLNENIKTLNQQKLTLTEQNEDLTSDLASLQTTHNSTVQDLAECEANLDACQNP